MKGLLRLLLYVLIGLGLLLSLPLIWYSLRSPAHYGDLIHGTVYSIATRSDGNGMAYKTSDPKAIATFEHAMNSVKLYLTTYGPVTGDAVYNLFDQQGKNMGAVAFEGNNIVRIEDKTFRMEPNPDAGLQPFFRALKSDQNIVKQAP